MANGYYKRRLMGPIILITIGVLFMLDELGHWGFDRTWPVILIVIGVVKIFERFFSPAGSTYVPPPAQGPTGSSANSPWQAPSSSPGSAPPSGSTQSSSSGGHEPPKT